jgi:putative nucleotidyltransferase with HDIG domain
MPQRYDEYLKKLPVIPDVASKIISIAEDKIDISFKELENIIKVDPSLTAKIMKIANSALYARQREISSLQMAITLLGFKNIKSLVLLVTASGSFQQHRNTEFYQIFWKHAVITAFLARHISLRSGRKESADEAFLGGLMHDIGQAAFFNADQAGYTELMKKAINESLKIEDLEEAAYGVDHRQVGASVLENWNFPPRYVDIAREHTSPNITSEHKAVIIILSLADLLTEILGFGFGTPGKEELLAGFLPHTSLTEADVSYYRTGFMADLKKDSLFHECQTVCGIN